MAQTILIEGFLWYSSVTAGECLGNIETEHDHFLCTDVTILEIKIKSTLEQFPMSSYRRHIFVPH
jgi:hypothetical protein